MKIAQRVESATGMGRQSDTEAIETLLFRPSRMREYENQEHVVSLLIILFCFIFSVSHE